MNELETLHLVVKSPKSKHSREVFVPSLKWIANPFLMLGFPVLMH